MNIHTNGLIVTANSDSEEIAIANFGFDKGTHYWEFYCPINCANIKVGVIKEGWAQSKNVNNISELFDFTTTTSRTIGIKLDLDKGEIRTWLNGNL